MALQFGEVTGRFVAVVADSLADEDRDPDTIPLQGTVTFTPQVSAVLVQDGAPAPFTALPAAIQVDLDSDGYLAHNGSRGVRLLATDGLSNPRNFTYRVSFNLSYGRVATPYPPFSITVPAKTVIDLTSTAPVPGSSGTAITQGVGIQGVVIKDGQFVFRMTDGNEKRVDLPSLESGSLELQAAKDYTDETVADARWLKPTVISSTTSVDTVTTPGLYQVPNSSSPGLPVTGVGMLQVMPLNRAQVQVFTQWGTSPRMWWRGFSTTGTPYAWQEIAKKSDLDAVSTRVAALESAGATPPPPSSGTKIVPLAITAPGTTVTATTDKGAARWVRRYAVAPRRVRVHVANRNVANGTNGSELNLSHIRVGTGDANGGYADGVVALSGGKIPAAIGAELVTPWATVNVPDGGYLAVTVAWWGGAGTATLQMMQGGGWTTTTDDLAGASTTAGWTRSQTTPFHVWIEAEVPATTPVILANGDSISLGTMTTDPVGAAWPALYAYQQGALPVLMGQHGSTMLNWVGTNGRWGLYGGTEKDVVDAVVMCLGQNDLAAAGMDLATLKTRYADVRAAHERYNAPVYIGGITPSTKTAAVESVRRDFNTWLKTLPHGERGFFDFAAAVGDSTDEDLAPAYTADGLHPNAEGQQRMADRVLAAPVTPYTPAPSKIKALLSA